MQLLLYLFMIGGIGNPGPKNCFRLSDQFLFPILNLIRMDIKFARLIPPRCDPLAQRLRPLWPSRR